MIMLGGSYDLESMWAEDCRLTQIQPESWLHEHDWEPWLFVRTPDFAQVNVYRHDKSASYLFVFEGEGGGMEWVLCDNFSCALDLFRLLPAFAANQYTEKR